MEDEGLLLLFGTCMDTHGAPQCKALMSCEVAAGPQLNSKQAAAAAPERRTMHDTWQARRHGRHGSAGAAQQMIALAKRQKKARCRLSRIMLCLSAREAGHMGNTHTEQNTDTNNTCMWYCAACVTCWGAG